jgi:hypothetical protein
MWDPGNNAVTEGAQDSKISLLLERLKRAEQRLQDVLAPERQSADRPED